MSLLKILPAIEKFVHEKRLIVLLGSKSQRRQQLLRHNILADRVQFYCLPPKFAEDFDHTKYNGKELVETYAREKVDSSNNLVVSWPISALMCLDEERDRAVAWLCWRQAGESSIQAWWNPSPLHLQRYSHHSCTQLCSLCLIEALSSISFLVDDCCREGRLWRKRGVKLMHCRDFNPTTMQDNRSWLGKLVFFIVSSVSQEDIGSTCLSWNAKAVMAQTVRWNLKQSWKGHSVPWVR